VTRAVTRRASTMARATGMTETRSSSGQP
jgi:hypothetical protein